MNRPVSSNPIDRIVYGIADAPKTLKNVVGGLPGVIRSAGRLPHAVADKVSWAFLGKHI